MKKINFIKKCRKVFVLFGMLWLLSGQFAHSVEAPQEFPGEKVVLSPNKYFVILSDCEDTFIREQAAKLELLYRAFMTEFEKVLPEENPELPLPCRIFNDFNKYSNFMKSLGMETPPPGQFVFEKRSRYVVTYRTANGDARNLFRETALQMFYEILKVRRAPIWLSEGLAEYWGDSQVATGSMAAGVIDPQKIPLLQWRMSENKLTSLANLLEEKKFAFAESHLLVHFLLQQKHNGKRLLNQMIKACRDDNKQEQDKVAEKLLRLEKKWREYIVAGAGQDWMSVWETWRMVDDSVYCKTTPGRCGIVLHKEEMPGRRKRFEISCEVNGAEEDGRCRGALLFSYLGKEQFVLLELYLVPDAPCLRLAARTKGKWRLLSITPIDKKYLKKGWNRIFLSWNELGFSFGINQQKTYASGFKLPKKWRCGLGVIDSSCYFRNFIIK